MALVERPFLPVWEGLMTGVIMKETLADRIGRFAFGPMKVWYPGSKEPVILERGCLMGLPPFVAGLSCALPTFGWRMKLSSLVVLSWRYHL